MKKLKDYQYEVKIIFTQICSGKNEQEARENLKNTFEEEFNLEITDDEITLIK